MYRGPSSAAPQCCTCSVQTLSKRRLAQVFSSAGSVAVLRDSTGVARVVHTLSKRRLTQVFSSAGSFAVLRDSTGVARAHAQQKASAAGAGQFAVLHRNSVHTNSTAVPQL